jgi:hypothetical protein
MSAKKAAKLAEALQDAADDMADEVEDELEGGARATRIQASRELQTNDSVANRDLINSFITDDTLPDLPRGEVGAMVAVTMPYAKYVEYGTGIFNTESDPLKNYEAPGFPSEEMIGRIRQWIILKGITAENRELQRVNLIEEQENLAFAIASQIATYGNRPHRFMRPAYRKRRDRIVQGTTRTVDKVYSW